MLLHCLSCVLACIVHHIHVIFLVYVSNVEFGFSFVFVVVSSWLLLLRFFLLLSMSSLLGSQGLGQVRHKPQKVRALDTFVENLVAQATCVCYARHQSGVLDLYRYFSQWLLSSLPSRVVSPLLIEVKAGFIDEDNLTATKTLCSVIR